MQIVHKFVFLEKHILRRYTMLRVALPLDFPVTTPLRRTSYSKMRVTGVF